jgi:tetratricopeptide (TPR) repeat protein
LCHKELGEFPAALADLRQAAMLAPTKGDRHFWLAVTLTQAYPKDSDSTAAALAEFKAAVAVDSTSKNASLAYQQIGFRDYLLKKDWAGAVAVLEKALAIDPTNKQTLIWLAQAYQNSGNRVKALEYYDKVLALDPAQPDAVKGKSMLQKSTKQSP